MKCCKASEFLLSFCSYKASATIRIDYLLFPSENNLRKIIIYHDRRTFVLLVGKSFDHRIIGMVIEPKSGRGCQSTGVGL